MRYAKSAVASRGSGGTGEVVAQDQHETGEVVPVISCRAPRPMRMAGLENSECRSGQEHGSAVAPASDICTGTDQQVSRA